MLMNSLHPASLIDFPNRLSAISWEARSSNAKRE
jgi:hypothetical protein